MRVSDYELTTLAAGLPPPDGDFDRVLTPMARELIAAWEPIPVMGSPSRAMLDERLRTADAILQRVADVSCDCDLIGCEHDDARAYLAAREGER